MCRQFYFRSFIQKEGNYFNQGSISNRDKPGMVAHSASGWRQEEEGFKAILQDTLSLIISTTRLNAKHILNNYEEYQHGNQTVKN